MSPSTIIVEVMEEFSGSNRWDVNFFLSDFTLLLATLMGWSQG